MRNDNQQNMKIFEARLRKATNKYTR